MTYSSHNAAGKPARKLRWLQFHLRSLLLLAVACCLASCFGPPRLELPPPSSGSDDIQYYPPGPEIRLSREAAAAKARQPGAEEQHSGQQNSTPSAK